MELTAQAFWSVLGQIVLAGGGGAVVAFAIFRFLGATWIEDKFKRSFEDMKHGQAKELQRLRIEIDSLLSGRIKLQEREFQLLPSLWEKLHEARLQLGSLVSALQSYPNLDAMSDRQLEEFFSESSDLRETEKQRIRDAHALTRRTDEYIDIIFWHRLRRAVEAIVAFRDHLQASSIFLPVDLYHKLDQALVLLWDAKVDLQVGRESKDYQMQGRASQTVSKKLNPLVEDIGTAFRARLQFHSHGDRQAA